MTDYMSKIAWSIKKTNYSEGVKDLSGNWIRYFPLVVYINNNLVIHYKEYNLFLLGKMQEFNNNYYKR